MIIKPQQKLQPTAHRFTSTSLKQNGTPAKKTAIQAQARINARRRSGLGGTISLIAALKP
jgi:hypothetical protein